MTAGAWKVYGNAIEKIADGTIDLDSDAFQMVLLTSAYTPNQSTHAAWSDLSAAEVADGNGYTAGGKTITQAVTRSGLTVTFDCDDQSWASSTITAKYAAIVRKAGASLAAGDIPLAYCDLDTGGGSLATTNGTLAVTINAAGVFTVTAS